MFKVGDVVHKEHRTFVVTGVNTVNGNVYLDEHVGVDRNAGILSTTRSAASMADYKLVEECLT